MRRGLWFMAGAVSGAYTLIKAKRTVNQFTPDGIGARMAALGAGARVFADEVNAGMQEREAELRADIQAQRDQRSITAAPARPDSPEGIDDGHR